MQVESSSPFAQIIQEHLALKEQNSTLEARMPIDRYKSQDPFENHPLFKTEEQARIEETLDGVEAPAAVETAEEASEESDDSLWTKSRDFDWGD